MKAMTGSAAAAGVVRRLRSCLALPFLIFALGAAPVILAQNTSTTVRHHKVGGNETPFPPELTQAETAISKTNYAGAEPLLKTVVERDPKNFQAWFDLGFVANALGKTDDSIAAYRKSVEAKPDVFESNLNLGLMLAKAKQPGAEPFLRAATQLKPTANTDEGHARAWLGLARVLETTDAEGAIKAYREVSAIRPKDTESRLEAGLLLEKENRFADAEEQYKQVLILDPSSADALTGLANIYMRGHRFGDAEEVLHKLLALHPDDPAAHVQFGRMLAADGKNDEAIAELLAAQKVSPQDAGLQRDLADLYVRAGKCDLAEAQYKLLLAANPKDPDVRYGMGEALLKQKKFADAQQQFLAAVQLKPDFGAAYGDLAVAADENKNYSGAIWALDARAKFLPEIPIGYFMRATAYDHLRDYKQAALNYHKFLEVANGQFPDNEWQARHRLIAIEPKK